jgi:hypothetical protein
MSTTVELTPAEIELIQLRREQEELAKKEAELKKAAKLEADIESQKKHIAKLLQQDAEQVQAAHSFNIELGGNWQVIVNEKMEKFTVKGEYTNPENPGKADYEREILWYTEELRRSAYIQYTPNPTFKIEIKEHWVSSRHSYRSSNKGYKMFLYGPDVDYKYQQKALIKAKTVNEKVQELVDAANAKLQMAAKQKSAVETTVEKMSALYPDATIEKGTGYERTGSGRRTDYFNYDQVVISFTNGIKITYRVYSDGSLGRKDITFNVKDSWELMDKLAKM